MDKKCFLCGKGAKYMIKGGKESYCEECAKENFSDLSYLVTVEEEAKRLKELVDKKMDQLTQLNEELDEKLEEKKEEK